MKYLVGDKKFYKRVIAISLPIMMQNGVSNFVNMLDNLMVGRLGTEQLSGVSIVNDLLFVFNLCLFGAISGAGIFTAQYYGQKNMKAVRDTFRIKLILCGSILVIGCVIFLLLNAPLINLYLHDGSQDCNLDLAFECGVTYIKIMVIGLIPLALENCYASTLRETGETVIPMIASFTAMFVNLIFNYFLIYGKCGFPELGVAGAAVATVLSRFVQLAIEIVWVKRNLIKVPFMEHAYESMVIPAELLKKVAIMGLPLLLNEGLWAAGIVVQKQSYSLRGLAVVAGMNINSTICNVFNVAFIAIGESVSIIVGQLMGAGKLKEAKLTAYRIIAFSLEICLGMGLIVALTSNLYPLIYNTTDEVRELASSFILVSAILMPLHGVLHASYFTIRSGGKTGITFLFDSGFLWVIGVPAAYIICRYTNLGIVTIFAIIEGLNIIKVIIGIIILRSEVWLQNITGQVS